MIDKKKILGQAGKLLKAAQQESESIINASKPFAKKALGKISDGAVSLGKKGKQIADDLNASPRDRDKDKE